MELTGDTNTPALPMTEAEVNHLRRLLAWMRCQWTLDPDMQRGCVRGAVLMVAHGYTSPERAGDMLAERAAQINRCPAYVRQAVKMLTKALRDHERKAGIVESAAFTPQAGKGYEVLTVSAGSPRPPAWLTDGGEQ